MISAAESTKVLCFLCNKAKGIYKCEGCSKVFCLKHSNDHRNELNKQLEEVVVTHDLVHQTLNQQTEDTQQHPLLKKINQWEQSAIDKIRQTAEKARNELLKDATQHTNKVKGKLQILSSEIKRGREDNDFNEIDLRQWTQKLEEMKTELLNPTTSVIQEDYTALVNNIRIAYQDIFESVYTAAVIKENGRLVVKNISSNHTEIRGRGEYRAGIHNLRFQVEKLEQNGWIFFGIISKTEAMRNTSYGLPSSYGWSNANQIYFGGQSTGQETLEIAQNDIIILSIDCDQRKVEMKNERLNRTIELSIDINKCSFPWQIHLNLYAANTQVRILT